MSKDEQKPNDKWREFSEQDETGVASEKPSEKSEKVVDDAHIDATADTACRDKVTLLEKEVLVLKDQCLRLQAENKNTMGRMEQEITKARKFGVEKLVADLVPVAESLARGLEGVVSDDPAVKLMRHGSELTLEMLHKLLEKNGVVLINPVVGDAFDPHQHEAMSMVPNPEAKSHTVMQVLQKGYALHGRVIRAAMVIVVA